MNILLTDYMACPRCGPPFRLVLVARQVADRRVRHGEFGCANCRDSFPVEDGFADMRPQPRRPPPPRAGDGNGRGTPGASAGGFGVSDTPGDGSRSRQDAGSGDALRLAAGLGVTEGPGIVIVWDGTAADAGALSEIVPGVEVVATGWAMRGCASNGVSAMAVGPALPFGDGTARGVVIAGDADAGTWRESVRVLGPGGRIVALASPEAASRMSAAGCVALARDEDLLVAAPGR